MLMISRSYYLVRCQLGPERYDEQCVTFDAYYHIWRHYTDTLQAPSSRTIPETQI